MGTIQEDDVFDEDRSLVPHVNGDGRRTIIINRSSLDDPLGLVLQSHIIQTSEGQLKRYTYIDSVTVGGLAHKSGMRNGDILIGVKGVDVMTLSHSHLLSLLSSTLEARVIVLAREHSRLISLHSQFFILRARLKAAEEEILAITGEEESILSKYRNRLRNSNSLIDSSCSSLTPNESKVWRGVQLTKMSRVDSQSISSQITRL